MQRTGSDSPLPSFVMESGHTAARQCRIHTGFTAGPRGPGRIRYKVSRKHTPLSIPDKPSLVRRCRNLWAMESGDFLVIDIETAGGSMNTFPRGFQLLLTGTLCGGLYGMYTAEQESLAALADLLEGFDGPVVTFNGERFDLPMLDHWTQEVLGRPLRVKHHYDLMIEIVRAAGHRISLDRLSQYTFGEEKVTWDHRHNAEVWETEPQRLIDYNRVDLDLTHELFMRVLRGEYLFLGDASVILPPPGH